MEIPELMNVLRSWLEEERNNIITSGDGSIVYRSEDLIAPAEVLMEKIAFLPENFTEEEINDRRLDLHVKVIRRELSHEGQTFLCYHFYDISEYTMLVKDVAAYSKHLSSLSRFQTNVMNRLAMPFDAFLPCLAAYCKENRISREVSVYLRDGDKVIRSVYDGKPQRFILTDAADYQPYFEAKDGEMVGMQFCLIRSEVMQKPYAVFIRMEQDDTDHHSIDLLIHNIVQLFIENSILREKIVHESEHDKLTGLYNKGKYIALREQCFGRPETIAIFNFDVNNLKFINDNYGHEFGDALIVKAARSIAAVTSDNVYGFRMGGDEYVMVGCGLTRGEAEQLRTDWRAALDAANSEDDGLFCAMACGMQFGEGDYDYEALYELADKEMYENKKQLKAQNIGSHVTANA